MKIWTNPQLSELTVANNKMLRYLDLRNCRVRNLDMSKCQQLTYFDCSNDSIKGNYANKWYGFDLPEAVPLTLGEEGKNSIADLHFISKDLIHVHADKNDLFCMDGLNGNANLKYLTYSYNHINAIDLSGCTSIDTLYDCTHNGRGAFEAEYAKWFQKNGNETDTCHIYYLQLDPNAGDELNPSVYDSFLGYKAGHDSIESAGSQRYNRVFDADGFNPNMVASFITNSSGPYEGHRGNNASLQANIVYGSDTIPSPDNIYGLVAILDLTDNPDKPNYHYIEYKYYDGRRSPSKAEEGSTSTFYMVWTAPPEPTEVEEIAEDGLVQPTVVSERYFDINGREYSEPFDGINIIVRNMSDGTTVTTKVIR